MRSIYFFKNVVFILMCSIFLYTQASDPNFLRNYPNLNGNNTNVLSTYDIKKWNDKYYILLNANKSFYTFLKTKTNTMLGIYNLTGTKLDSIQFNDLLNYSSSSAALTIDNDRIIAVDDTNLFFDRNNYDTRDSMHRYFIVKVDLINKTHTIIYRDSGIIPDTYCDVVNTSNNIGVIVNNGSIKSLITINKDGTSSTKTTLSYSYNDKIAFAKNENEDAIVIALVKNYYTTTPPIWPVIDVSMKVYDWNGNLKKQTSNTHNFFYQFLNFNSYSKLQIEQRSGIYKIFALENYTSYSVGNNLLSCDVDTNGIIKKAISKSITQVQPGYTGYYNYVNTLFKDNQLYFTSYQYSNTSNNINHKNYYSVIINNDLTVKQASKLFTDSFYLNIFGPFWGITYNVNSISSVVYKTDDDYLLNINCSILQNNKDYLYRVQSIPTVDIAGSVFYDSITNCVKDSSESYLKSVIIRVKDIDRNQYLYTTTNNAGKYSITLEKGTYTFEPISPSIYWKPCDSSKQLIIDSTLQQDTINFGIQQLVSCPYLTIDISTDRLRRCFENTYTVKYKNNGTSTATNAYILIDFDKDLKYINSSIPAIKTINNTYKFLIGNIAPQAANSFFVNVYLDTTCNATIVGQTHCVAAHIYPDSSCVPPDPRWDSSIVSVSAECIGDSILFRIQNIGTGDMQSIKKYIVIEGDLMRIRPTDFQLRAGEQIIFKRVVIDSTAYILAAEQSDFFPYPSYPIAFVEGCDSTIQTEIINQYPHDDAAPFLAISCVENRSSFDPNEKEAIPVGYDTQHYIKKTDEIEYIIHFQNTGNDTAYNVVISDTISRYLNPASIQMGTSSHTYTYEITQKGVLNIYFKNINLLDSSTNNIASNGFIKFRIQQKTDNTIGTIINNSASIYFDNNTAIITNETYHTIGENYYKVDISTNTINKKYKIQNVKVYPNPFVYNTQIIVDGEIINDLHLEIKDLFGRNIYESISSTNTYDFEKGNLSNGIYFFSLKKGNETIATGKIIIQ